MKSAFSNAMEGPSQAAKPSSRSRFEAKRGQLNIAVLSRSTLAPAHAIPVREIERSRGRA